MAEPICDLFPMLVADGPTHMAADDVLLEHAIEAGRPALRFYTWDPPTLSLGYFQAYADRLTTLPFVRRPTGGGAIVHHHELTYALALPSGPIQKSTNWACRMHEIIRDALATFGAAATAKICPRSTTGGKMIGRGAFLCFEDQTPGAVLLGGQKIVGSAQRKRGRGLLQHGSILLAASPFAPERVGIRELAGFTIDPYQLVDATVRSFAQKTGWRSGPVAWSIDESARREQVAQQRYQNPAWTERR
jgi:lipoyl(octanoyl) transferase